MDGSVVDQQADIFGDVGGVMADPHLETEVLQIIRLDAFRTVGTGDVKALLSEYECESAHAHSADADEMNVAGLL